MRDPDRGPVSIHYKMNSHFIITNFSANPNSLIRDQGYSKRMSHFHAIKPRIIITFEYFILIPRFVAPFCNSSVHIIHLLNPGSSHRPNDKFRFNPCGLHCILNFWAKNNHILRAGFGLFSNLTLVQE